MPAPTTYPAWMAKTGAENALVLDVNGYNAASAQGYSTPTNAPARTTVKVVTIIENELSPGQSGLSESMHHG